MSIIDINSVHWVIAATAEAPWQSCRRLGIGYSPVVDDVLPWNTLALDAALNSLGRNLTPIAQTAYGIDGCCVPVRIATHCVTELVSRFNVESMVWRLRVLHAVIWFILCKLWSTTK
jgi:hypothetical protein